MEGVQGLNCSTEKQLVRSIRKLLESLKLEAIRAYGGRAADYAEERERRCHEWILYFTKCIIAKTF